MLSGSGLPPNSTITVWDDTDCAETTGGPCDNGTDGGENHYVSEGYSVDGNGNLSAAGRYFGYIGAHVWVDTQAYGQTVRSNTITR
jgi:hypothetical protein